MSEDTVGGREVVPAIVGTAGHVDHGKTALVTRLTGRDTDTLREEKERGLSINLGFAACPLPDGRVVGVVDVPGHRDFMRNMVAGASNIDVVMLVVAADDGVMPQTEEHIRIARLLGMRRLMAVATKKDLVDEEMLELALDDIRDLLSRMGYPDAPVVAASSETGEGVEEVRRVLSNLVDEASAGAFDERAFRLNVDRAFKVEGYGTVVTGVPVSGRVRVGDEVEVLPKGVPTSVRNIQNHDVETETTKTHTRTALNLRDVELDDVQRGAVVALSGIYSAAGTVCVKLRNEGPVVIKNRSEVRFHVGTSAVVAKVVLLGRDVLRPGEKGFVDTVLSAPVVLSAGDRFIMRRLSPSETLGGGRVLSVSLDRPRRSSPALLERLKQAVGALDKGDYFGSELLAGSRALLKGDDLSALTRMSGDAAQQLIRKKEEEGRISSLGGRTWLVSDRIPDLLDFVARELKRYHGSHKYSWGMAPALVCDMLGVPQSSWYELSRVLRRDTSITVKHGRLALSSFEPELSNREMDLRENALKRISEAGVNAPAGGDLARELGMSKQEARLISRLLTEEGLVTVVGRNLMLSEVYEKSRRQLLDLFQKKDLVEVVEFKELLGAGRNVTIAMLESFDAEGLTRRTGRGRVLVRKP